MATHIHSEIVKVAGLVAFDGAGVAGAA